MNNKLQYKMGIDVGSTTVKIVIVDSHSQIIYKTYKRHQANIQQTLVQELQEVDKQYTDAVNYNIVLDIHKK